MYAVRMTGKRPNSTAYKIIFSLLIKKRNVACLVDKS